MIDPAADFIEQLPERDPSPGKIGHPAAAWLVIGIMVAFVLVRHARSETQNKEHFDRGMLELQGRYAVGVADLLGQRNAALLRQLQSLEGTDPEQRLRFAVLAGELGGPQEALEVLDKLPADPEADTETIEALKKIYRSADRKTAAPPPPDAAAIVREKLGWFGELAAAPPDTPDTAARTAALAPARRTAVVFLAFASVALLSVAAGVIVLAAVVVLSVNGTLRPRLATGSSYGGVYAETFAVWLVLFCALSFVLGLAPVNDSRMLLAGLCTFASLAALAWPVVRGVPWRVVLLDVGLAAPAKPGTELAAGVATYAVAVPLAAGGVLLTFVLMTIARHLGLQTSVSHPLAPFIVESGVWGRIQAVLVATVAAPIVEETMFRGVLYRHLRESTAGWGRALSVMTSAVLVSFVFAVIHPQGWLGLPPLMALAFAFCLAREWRGTLLPAMVAHALQNGAVTLMIISAIG
jgi:membrane protease YdiL (CAAX protease family)